MSNENVPSNGKIIEYEWTPNNPSTSIRLILFVEEFSGGLAKTQEAFRSSGSESDQGMSSEASAEPILSRT
jgi:hypothetical protein